jgi:hypothetical protein
VAAYIYVSTDPHPIRRPHRFAQSSAPRSKAPDSGSPSSHPNYSLFGARAARLDSMQQTGSKRTNERTDETAELPGLVIAPTSVTLVGSTPSPLVIPPALPLAPGIHSCGRTTWYLLRYADDDHSSTAASSRSPSCRHYRYVGKYSDSELLTYVRASVAPPTGSLIARKGRCRLHARLSPTHGCRAISDA